MLLIKTLYVTKRHMSQTVLRTQGCGETLCFGTRNCVAAMGGLALKSVLTRTVTRVLVYYVCTAFIDKGDNSCVTRPPLTWSGGYLLLCYLTQVIGARGRHTRRLVRRGGSSSGQYWHYTMFLDLLSLLYHKRILQRDTPPPPPFLKIKCSML